MVLGLSTSVSSGKLLEIQTLKSTELENAFFTRSSDDSYTY